jgi:hypothetical protein
VSSEEEIRTRYRCDSGLCSYEKGKAGPMESWMLENKTKEILIKPKSKCLWVVN